MCQNLVPLVNIKIAGKWMFIPLKMLLIGIDPYPYDLGILHNSNVLPVSSDDAFIMKPTMRREKTWI